MDYPPHYLRLNDTALVLNILVVHSRYVISNKKFSKLNYTELYQILIIVYIVYIVYISIFFNLKVSVKDIFSQNFRHTL